MKTGLQIKTERLTNELNDLNTKYNRRSIFKRAMWLAANDNLTWSEALTQSWKESKEAMVKVRNQANEIKEIMNNFLTPMHPAFSIQAHYAACEIALINETRI